MRKYELTYLISDEVQEADLNKVTGKVTGFISDLGGKMTKEDIWGRRKLVYPIKKQNFATYVTLFFELPADKMSEFDRDLRLTGKILRHLLIVKDYGSEEISLSAEEIANAASIEEVVGGEKSFEAVVGETEESKELMAKREKEKEEVKEETKEIEPASENLPEVKEETLPTVPETKEVAEVKETEVAPVEEKEEPSVSTKASLDEKKTKKTSNQPTGKAGKKEESSEVDRLTKLNEELDDILKDEL